MNANNILLTNEPEVKTKTKVDNKGDTQKELETTGEKIKAEQEQ